MSLDFNTLEPIKSRTQALLLILAFLFSVFALAGVLYTLIHIPKPEPVSIQCSPDLLKKIESQAQILEEIAKTTKPKN
ncbi:MAG: hypothetical protein QG568_614 [Patescibacteria group bacterium]|nr:hypothetical protein [Patescibacteria group bacterium]